MKRFAGIALTILVFAITGRPGMASMLQQHNMSAEQMGMMNQMMQPQACPMKVPGAEVAMSNTKDGVAVTFTAKSAENVADLRRRVEQMAKMHDSMSGMPMMAGNMTASKMKVEEVPSGARMTMTPQDPAKLADLRKQMAAHTDDLKKGDCMSMMQGVIPGMMPATPQGTTTPAK